MRTDLLAHMSDPFDVRTPVRGDDRFGRDAMVAALIGDLQNHVAIGVFGLRKMGKTTVIHAVIERLDPPRIQLPGPEWLICGADAQMYLDVGVAGLCGALVNSLHRRCAVDLPASGAPLADLRRAVELALHDRRRVCLVIDEFDWIVSGDNAYAADAVTLLAVLRGMVQTWSDRLRLVFVGRVPERLNGAALFGAANPVMNMFRGFWVGPMSHSESDELLTRLGQRAGLTVGPRTCVEGWRLAGGHPLMARLYGSAVMRRVRGEAGAMFAQEAPTDRVALDAGKDLLRGADARVHFDEVRQLLAEVRPRAFDLLRELALDADTRRWDAAQDTHPEEVRMLVHFGLAEAVTGCVPEVLAHFMRPLPKRIESAA